MNIKKLGCNKCVNRVLTAVNKLVNKNALMLQVFVNNFVSLSPCCQRELGSVLTMLRMLTVFDPQPLKVQPVEAISHA